MKLSVLIPTFRRPSAINQCLASLAGQSCSVPFEVIVGLDGDYELTPDPVIPDSIVVNTHLLRDGRLGLIRLRKRMLEQAKGELILWLNDDAYPCPGLLQSHVDMHHRHSLCVVAGAARWKPIERPDLFDRLVQQTDLVFFQSNARLNSPCQTDYRNCFGLNMSFMKSSAMQVGGVPELIESYGYDDIELVHRLVQAGAQVWYCPEAMVEHDHRYRPLDVHRREYLLGRAAWHYAKLNPGFAADLFGRDICSEQELGEISQSLVRSYRDALRIERSFLSYDGFAFSDSEVGAKIADEQLLLNLLSEHWVLLKRYLWQWGLRDAAMGVESQWGLLSDKCPV